MIRYLSVALFLAVVAGCASKPGLPETKDSDFRKTWWGMSMATVMQTEQADLTFENTQDGKLGYTTELGNYMVGVGYYFSNDQLVEADYEVLVLEDSAGYSEAFDTLMTWLMRKHGDPHISEAACIAQSQEPEMANSTVLPIRCAGWKGARTYLSLNLYKYQGYRLQIYYVAQGLGLTTNSEYEKQLIDDL